MHDTLIARAHAVADLARRNEPLQGCPHADPDLVRAYTLGAAAELLDALAYRLELATTTTTEQEPRR